MSEELRKSGIADDGKGFDEEKAVKEKTLGVLGMKERTAMIGGNYAITSEPGKGTIVTIVLAFKTQTA